MDQFNLYSKYHGVQRSDATYVLTKFFQLVRWSEDNVNVLDVGCGDGDVTIEVLFPLLPENLNKLVGMDASKGMVNLANSKCGSNKKLDFVEGDISKEIPLRFEKFFDHIFSFYCLHWIQDQRKALENLHFMLKPKGDILLVFLARNPIFTIYETMAKSNKWGPYLQNYKRFVSPYHDSNDPVNDFEELISLTGFRSHFCRLKRKSFTYDNQKILQESAKAVNPFISQIPTEELENYMVDFYEEVKKVDGVKIETDENNNTKRIHVTYDLLVVYASKSISV